MTSYVAPGLILTGQSTIFYNASVSSSRRAQQKKRSLSSMSKRYTTTIARPLSILLLTIGALLVLACSQGANNVSNTGTPTSTSGYVSIPIVSTPVPEEV